MESVDLSSLDYTKLMDALSMAKALLLNEEGVYSENWDILDDLTTILWGVEV